MTGSFEKSVKGATKIKLAPPKAKYVEHILVATHAGDAGVAEVFRVLQLRLRDSTWTIVFKSLILTHLMIREGEPDVTLRFLADQPTKLAISNFSDGTFKEYKSVSARSPTELQIQGTNIRHYYNYILARAKAFKETKVDWVRGGVGRLKRQTVDKGLLRETEAVQHQISSLLKCDLLNSEAENEVTVCAFRLLTMDLLVLYGVMNEGTINVLEHYFEMSKVDGQRALNIYKTFTKQTNAVVEFLSVARQYENATRLEIPKLKHAPTSLTSSLEEYLNDPDFEVNRRQYLAHQDVKKGGKPTAPTTSEVASRSTKAVAPPSNAPNFTQSGPQQSAAPAVKGPAPDLIDFFESIEQNQQPMAFQAQNSSNFQQAQPTGMAPNQPFFVANGQQPFAQGEGALGNTNPFGQPAPQLPQQNFGNAAFGGFTQQTYAPATQQDTFSNVSHATGSTFPSQQQNFSTGQTSIASFQQPFNTGSPSTQTTNPFRQSMFPQATGGSAPNFQSQPPVPATLSPQSTNPFARSATIPMNTQASGSAFTSPFTSSPPQISSQLPPQQLTPQRTGTNPFAKSVAPQNQFPTSPVTANPTGSTNPFRQSMFVNQQTGQGMSGDQSGFDSIPTVPVFPRPTQQTQQTQQSPWS